MSLPNRNNPYSFETFLERREAFDFYADDPFFQKTIRYHLADQFDEVDAKLRTFSKKVSGQWRKWSETNKLPENRPWMMHFDGHNNRIDRIVRPPETLMLEKEVYGSGLFSSSTHLVERLAKNVLLSQLGEAGVNCSLACTEGMIWLLKAFEESISEEAKQILLHCTEGVEGDFGIGSQFVTEIQGGSDVPANMVEAVPEDDHYRLYGVKFFCSAANADYAVVTAKVSDSNKVSTFVVPSWLPDDKLKEKRNSYIIRRLKRKLGTISLPTAEIEYQGAKAYPVGTLGRGVANMVGLVLTQSRISVSTNNTGTSLRAAREARMYGEFRKVFGATISELPLTARVLDDLEHNAKRCLAGLFKVYSLFLKLGARLVAGLPKDEDLQVRKQKFLLRMVIMLQKITTAWDTTDAARLAMSVMGGHGVMECFSDLPKLYRDAAINEQWEGPRNLLLHQLHQDLNRVSEWYSPKEFVADLLAGATEAITQEHTEALEAVIQHDFRQNTKETRRAANQWDRLVTDLFHAYQDVAVEEIETFTP